MANERQSIISSIEGLKKAGMPTAVTVAIILLSSPGFYEFFFNRTDDEAVAKAEVAYEILRERFEHQSREIDRIETELRDLKIFLRSYIVHEPLHVGSDGESDSKEEGGEGSGIANPGELFGDDSIRDLPNNGNGKKLPDSLDDRSLADMISRKVSKE